MTQWTENWPNRITIEIHWKLLIGPESKYTSSDTLYQLVSEHRVFVLRSSGVDSPLWLAATCYASTSRHSSSKCARTSIARGVMDSWWRGLVRLYSMGKACRQAWWGTTTTTAMVRDPLAGRWQKLMDTMPQSQASMTTRGTRLFIRGVAWLPLGTVCSRF